MAVFNRLESRSRYVCPSYRHVTIVCNVYYTVNPRQLAPLSPMWTTNQPLIPTIFAFCWCFFLQFYFRSLLIYHNFHGVLLFSLHLVLKLLSYRLNNKFSFLRYVLRPNLMLLMFFMMEICIKFWGSNFPLRDAIDSAELVIIVNSQLKS